MDPFLVAIQVIAAVLGAVAGVGAMVTLVWSKKLPILLGTSALLLALATTSIGVGGMLVLNARAAEIQASPGISRQEKHKGATGARSEGMNSLVLSLGGSLPGFCFGLIGILGGLLRHGLLPRAPRPQGSMRPR